MKTSATKDDDNGKLDELSMELGDLKFSVNVIPSRLGLEAVQYKSVLL